MTGRRWSVRIPPGTQPATTTNRYLVLQAWQGETEGHVVVDLMDGWVGFVPWVDPAAPGPEIPMGPGRELVRS